MAVQLGLSDRLYRVVSIRMTGVPRHQSWDEMSGVATSQTILKCAAKTRKL